MGHSIWFDDREGELQCLHTPHACDGFNFLILHLLKGFPVFGLRIDLWCIVTR